MENGFTDEAGVASRGRDCQNSTLGVILAVVIILHQEHRATLGAPPMRHLVRCYASACLSSPKNSPSFRSAVEVTNCRFSHAVVSND
jgi:hypothetical protein